jgi:hypothetical protein
MKSVGNQSAFISQRWLQEHRTAEDGQFPSKHVFVNYFASCCYGASYAPGTTADCGWHSPHAQTFRLNRVAITKVPATAPLGQSW